MTLGRIHIRAQLERERATRAANGHGTETTETAELVVPGVLATTSEVVHWFPDLGFVRVTLAITDALVTSWGIDTLPFMRDHARAVDTMIGRVRALRAEGDELVAEFWFDPELGAKYHAAVDRGTLTDLSVGADIFELALVEPGDEATLPLYRAVRWQPFEGSLVWSGADPAAAFRRQSMNPDDIKKGLRALGVSVEQMAALMRGAAAPAAATASEATPASNGGDETEPTPVIDLEQLGGVIARNLLAAARPEAPAPAAPAPEKPDPMALAMASAIKLGVGLDVIERASKSAGGDAERFGRMIHAELARTQHVPEMAPRAPGITGGEDMRLGVLRDTETILLARAMPYDSEAASAAAKVDPRWQQFPMFGLVERAARVFDPQLAVVVNKTEFLREQMRLSYADGAALASMGGFCGRFVRAGGELLPGDLPTVFGSVFHKVLLAGYTKDRLPLDLLARRETFSDFRDKRLIHIDIAGQFEALAAGENLRQLVMREGEGTARAQAHGHILTVGFVAIINDDIGALSQVPLQMGEWAAAMESMKFQLVVVVGPNLNGNYPADYDRVVTDPAATFGPDLEDIRQHAIGERPVPAGAGEDPRNEAGRTYALVPTVMLYAPSLMKPWQTYSESVNLAVSRADGVRTSFERRLYDNSHEGLYLPADTYYAYPGPTSSFCPLAWGRVGGQDMTLTVHGTAPEEQSGLKYRMEWTFAAGFAFKNAAWRVRRAS